MKKFLTYLLILSSIFVFYGCSKDLGTEPTTEILDIVIPESFIKLGGSGDVEGSAQALRDLGEEYSTSVEVRGKDIYLRATKEQRANLIKRNNEYASKFLKRFLEANPEYKYFGSEDYTKLDIYVDENLDKHALGYLTLVVAYAYNNVLVNDGTDWSLFVTVYNCNTNKRVAGGELPKEEFTITPEDWKRSYEE